MDDPALSRSSAKWLWPILIALLGLLLILWLFNPSGSADGGEPEPTVAVDPADPLNAPAAAELPPGAEPAPAPSPAAT